MDPVVDGAEYEGEDDEGREVVIPGVNDLPLFASAEAKKIDLDNKEKESQVETKATLIGDLAERLKVMQEHFKNVQLEVSHTNSLVNAKRNEIKTEKHLKQLASRALGRSQVESKTIKEDIEKTQERLNSVQNQIFQANEKMDEFKMQMNWNQEELDQWAVAARQKEEDNLALQKYTRADEVKIKELNLNLELLSKQLLQIRSDLENEVTDTQAKQMELDRISDEFRQMHRERQQLVTQWQETIQMMKQRDVEINEIGEKYAIAKQERVKMEAKVTTQHKRLNTQIAENEEVDQKAESLNKILSKKREEMLNGNTRLVEFRSELESLKNELTSAAEGLVNLRTENSNLARDIEEKRVQVERERAKYKQVKQKLEDTTNNANQAEQSAKQAEDELQDAETELNLRMSKLKTLKEDLFRESQRVAELKREENLIRAEAAGTKTASRNLDVQLAQLDKDAARQQELLYNAEFQIQQIERKVARGLGERSDDEKKALKAQIEAAEKTLGEVKEKRKVLIAQSRKLLNELILAKTAKENQGIHKNELKEKIGEIELENRMIEEEVRRGTRAKEELIVLNDVLRLEVRRLREQLAAQADVVYSLENRKQQLILSMQERKQEISVHKDVLKAELKTLLEEKHSLTMDLRNRELTVEKLKSRFEASQTTKDDEGHGQSYYIIQAAQKREELRRRGDEYDAAIRKCEREIRALQTTLDHLNARNAAYRASFQKVDTSGDEGEVLRQLEERTRLAKEGLFRKKKELQRLVTDFEEDSRKLEQVKSQISKTSQQRGGLVAAKDQLEDELLTQEANLDELLDKIKRASATHRQKASQLLGVSASQLQPGSTTEEKLVRAEVLRDVVQVSCTMQYIYISILLLTAIRFCTCRTCCTQWASSPENSLRSWTTCQAD
jgi:chromosome segregation ATPase